MTPSIERIPFPAKNHKLSCYVL